jgi:hypothetical protein
MRFRRHTDFLPEFSKDWKLSTDFFQSLEARAQIFRGNTAPLRPAPSRPFGLLDRNQKGGLLNNVSTLFSPLVYLYQEISGAIKTGTKISNTHFDQ